MSPTGAGAPSNPSPIADLSYRHYDGPLHSRRVRGGIIALSTVRLALRNKWFYMLALGAFIPYVFNGVQYYFASLVAKGDPTGGALNPMAAMVNSEKPFATLFYKSFAGWEMLYLFAIALLVGAGGIAADNRANALQVYLSKPITKADYLLGKWLGVFLVVAGAALLPALLTFAVLGMTYVDEGFFKNEPWLIGRVLVSCLIPAVTHASLVLGFSAWSRSPRIAGAMYAGFYFVVDIVVTILWGALYGMHMSRGVLLRHLTVSGVITGLAQNVYDVSLKMPAVVRRRSLETITLNPPNASILLAVGVLACVLALLAAYWRVRAVEVVKG